VVYAVCDGGFVMKKSIVFAGFAVAVAAGVAGAAELKMTWRGHADDGERALELAVGEEAIIDIWFTLGEGDTLSGLFYRNEVVEGLVQVGTAPNEAIGWSDEGTNDGTSLGSGGQWIIFAAPGGVGMLDSPGEVLIGSQTIRLVDAGGAAELEIVFDAEQINPVDETGSFYSMVASGSELENNAGFFQVGSGSPGYSTGGLEDERDPLIVRVADGGGGGGGGGGGDGDDDGVPDDEDDFPDDPEETTDTDGDGVGDNADTDDDNDDVADDEDAFPDDPEETTDTDNDGTGDNADTDDDDDGIPDDEDDTPLGGGNDNSQATSGAASPGPCGFGLVSALPLGVLGLLVLHWGRGRQWTRMGADR